MIAVAQASFARMLAACGVPPALYDPMAPATAIKESLRLWHMGTVVPLARLLEHELSARLDTKVRLIFDTGSVAKSGWLVTCLRDLERGVEA